MCSVEILGASASPAETAGSQADRAKSQPGALEELPHPAAPLCSPALPLPLWPPWAGHRVQPWQCAGGSLGLGQRLPAHGQGETEPSSASAHLLILRAVCCTPQVSLLGAKPVQIMKLPINLAAHLLVSGCVCICAAFFLFNALLRSETFPSTGFYLVMTSTIFNLYQKL